MAGGAWSTWHLTGWWVAPDAERSTNWTGPSRSDGVLDTLVRFDSEVAMLNQNGVDNVCVMRDQRERLMKV
jgi:hypothetical protein